jgi:hypothetical protein
MEMNDHSHAFGSEDQIFMEVDEESEESNPEIDEDVEGSREDSKGLFHKADKTHLPARKNIPSKQSIIKGVSSVCLVSNRDLSVIGPERYGIS